MRTTVIYHRDGSKTTVSSGGGIKLLEDGNFKSDAAYHENIIDSYRRLENEGKLSDMSARNKQRIRDVHTYAKEKGYWS